MVQPRWIAPRNDPLNWVAPSFDFMRIPPDIQMSDPIYDQINFRIRDDSTALNTDGGWFAAENVNVTTGIGLSTVFRLRFTLDETNSKTASPNFNVRYARNGSGSYTQVTTTSEMVRMAAGSPTDQAACSTQLLGSAPSGTFDTNGSYYEDPSTVTASWANTKDGFAEFEVCVQLTGEAKYGDTFDFRLYNATIPLGAYTVTPRITVTPQEPYVFAHRWQADDGVEGSGGASALSIEDGVLDVGVTSIFQVAEDENIRLRIGVAEPNVANPATSTVQLVAAKLTGSGLKGTPFDVTGSSTEIRMAASSHFASGDATTDHSLTAPGGTFLAGEMDETDGLTGSLDLAQNQYTIVEFCVQVRDVDTAGTDSWALGVTFGGVTLWLPGSINSVFSNQLAIIPYEAHGRFRDDDGDESSTGATFLKADDVGMTIGPAGDVAHATDFRIRTLLEDLTGDSFSGGSGVHSLRYSMNGGPWTIVGTTAQTDKPIRMGNSSNLTQDAECTDHGLTVTATGQFHPGDQVTSNQFSGGEFPLSSNWHMNYEFSVETVAANWNDGDVMRFATYWNSIYLYGTTHLFRMPDSFNLTQPVPPLSVASYRWRDDDGVEGSGGATFLDIEEQILRVGQASEHGIALDQNVRLRLLLDENNIENPVASTLQLYYRKNGGAAVDVTGSSTNIRMSASTHFASGNATTDHGFTAPAGTFLAGEMDETDGLTGSLDLAQNQYTIVEFCVQIRSADVVGEDAFTFGLTHNSVDLDTDGLDAFGDAGVLPLEAHGRFRDDDGDESSTGATFFVAQDVDATVGSGETIEHDTIFRLRTLLEELDAVDNLDSAPHALYYRVNGGAIVGVGGQGATDKYIRYADSALTLDDPCTDHGMTVTATGVFFAGEQREAILTLAALVIDDDDYLIDEWGLETYSANWSGGDVVEFLIQASRLGGAEDGYYLLPLTLTDVSSGSHDVAATDGLKLGDTGSVLGTFGDDGVDGLELGDTAIAGIVTPAAASDGLKLGDSATIIKAVPTVAADGLELGDTGAADVRTAADGVDGLDLGDSANADIVTATAGADGLELGDTADVRADYLIAASDGLELGDTGAVNVIGAGPPGHSSLCIVFG